MYKYIIFSVSILLFVACETDSDIVLNNSQSYVLTSFIYPDSDVVANVYKSVTYNDAADYACIGNANVKFSVNGELHSIATLSDGATSVTFANSGLKGGDKVSVELMDKDLTTLCNATTTILEPIKIDSISTYKQMVGIEAMTKFVIAFTDPTETTDYYQLKIRYHEKLPDGTDIIRTPECDFYDYLFYIARSTYNVTNSLMPSGVFTDELINGRKVNISVRISQNELAPQYENSELILEFLLFRHTSEYYNFLLTSYMISEYLILPVFGIATIYNNVENGVGLVSGMSYSSYKINVDRNKLGYKPILKNYE